MKNKRVLNMAKSYENAGVNLEAGYEVVSRIKKHVASTKRVGSMGGIGSFGGMFDLSALNIADPVLVSGTDGVGTKLKLAFEMDKHDTIGIDAVAMCVNDVLAQGAEPLYFLDYVAIGHNIPEKVEQILYGVSQGCIQADLRCSCRQLQGAVRCRCKPSPQLPWERRLQDWPFQFQSKSR